MNGKYVIDYLKLKKVAWTFLFIIVALFLAYKSIYYLAPFIIAFALSSLIEPIVRLLVVRTKLSRKLASAVSVVLALGVLGYLLSALIGRIIIEIKGIIRVLPFFVKEVSRNITDLNNGSSKLIIGLPGEFTQHIGIIVTKSFDYIDTILKSVLQQAFNTAASLPAALIFVLVTILATFFLSSDRAKISAAIQTQIPSNWYSNLILIKNEVFISIFKLIKAYIIIMCITFTELLIGFSIIKVRYALVLAFIVCIVDILPVLGTGTVLIPWSIYGFITGNTPMGVSIIILYAVILVVRQIIEPKIIGDHIGVHPLITLMAIYIGLKLLGAVGLLLGPITMLILKNIFESLYKDKKLIELIFKPIKE
jgi:sporulation integral membrane protein YtvI